MCIKMDTYIIMNIPAVINLIKLSLDNTLDSNAWWIFLFLQAPGKFASTSLSLSEAVTGSHQTRQFNGSPPP